VNEWAKARKNEGGSEMMEMGEEEDKREGDEAG